MSFHSIADPHSVDPAPDHRCALYWRCWRFVRDFLRIIEPVAITGVMRWFTSDSLLRRLRCEVRRSRSKRFIARGLPDVLAFAPSLIVAIGLFLTARTHVATATNLHSALLWRGWAQLGRG